MRGRGATPNNRVFDLPKGVELDIERAVDTALANARGATDVESVARSWAASRDRILTIEEAQLPVGIFGQWLSAVDADIIQVRRGIVARERTIAHELGHMILGHRGAPVNDYLAQNVQVIDPALVNYLLQRSCETTSAATSSIETSSTESDVEICAERFAARLTWRLHSQNRGTGPELSLDETFG